MKSKYLKNGGKTIYLETEAEVDMFELILGNGIDGYNDISHFTDKEKEIFHKFNSREEGI